MQNRFLRLALATAVLVAAAGCATTTSQSSQHPPAATVKPGHRVIGVSLVIARGRTVLVADTAVTEMPNAQDLAETAVEAIAR